MEQKKFDYNSFIGMILLAGIMLWYFNTNKPEDLEEQQPQEVVETTTNIAKENTKEIAAPVFQNDSLQQVALQNKLGAFAQSAINGTEGTTVIENNLVRLTIDNKGGQIVKALIKNYQTYDSLPLYMIKDNNASFNINFGTTDNRILNTKDLFFEPSLTKSGDNQILSMKLKVSDSQYLEYRYEIKPKKYFVDFSIRSQGLDGVFNSSNPINLVLLIQY
jgi:YidC/Oxa1 family membrane protein insertase